MEYQYIKKNIINILMLVAVLLFILFTKEIYNEYTSMFVEYDIFLCTLFEVLYYTIIGLLIFNVCIQSETIYHIILYKRIKNKKK